MKIFAAALSACLFAAVGAHATSMNKAKAGELVIDPPTLINLGFEWVIQGATTAMPR